MNTNIKILLEDDSDFMRKYIAGFLNEAGYNNIIEAENGKVAVEKFTKEKPDIVFLDIIMPVETGLEALTEIVKLKGNVILVSAVGQAEIIEKAMQIGAKGYFVKPFFDPSELKAKINEILK